VQAIATVKIWEKPAILWRNSMCRHSVQKQSLKTPNFCFSIRGKQKDLISYYFCLAYSCNLRGKKTTKKPYSYFLLICYTVDVFVISVTDNLVLLTEIG